MGEDCKVAYTGTMRRYNSNAYIDGVYSEVRVYDNGSVEGNITIAEGASVVTIMTDFDPHPNPEGWWSKDVEDLKRFRAAVDEYVDAVLAAVEKTKKKHAKAEAKANSKK